MFFRDNVFRIYNQIDKHLHESATALHSLDITREPIEQRIATKSFLLRPRATLIHPLQRYNTPSNTEMHDLLLRGTLFNCVKTAMQVRK